jgi:hypothetical protein
VRYPLFASLEGRIILGGIPSFDDKRNAVGMLTKIKISIAHGVLAGLGVNSQATAKISITKLGNLAISLVWQIKKVFHRKKFTTNLQDVKLWSLCFFAFAFWVYTL